MAKKTSKTSTPLRLDGALDIQNATALHARLTERLAVTTPVFALDLSGVTECDSAGLQLLCAARRSTISAGREWRLINPSQPILRACADVALSPEKIGL